MKLIIDVEKDYYEMLKYNVEHGQEYKPFEIIANGIPYEERPQGEWIDTRDMNEYWAEEYQCSICGAKDHWHNFCPNCGADMRNITETPSSCTTTNPNSVEAYHQSLKDGAV